jgi:hypothetical protein
MSNKLAFGVLTPPENGAGEFSGQKDVNIFQDKLGSRVVQVEKYDVYSEFMYTTPNTKK